MSVSRPEKLAQILDLRSVRRKQLCCSMARGQLRTAPSEPAEKDPLCEYTFQKAVELQLPAVKNFLVFLLYRVVPLQDNNHPILRSLLNSPDFPCSVPDPGYVMTLHLPHSKGTLSCLQQYTQKGGSVPVFYYFDYVQVIIDDVREMLVNFSDISDLCDRFKLSPKICHVRISFFLGGSDIEKMYFSLCYNLSDMDIHLSLKLFSDYNLGNPMIALSSPFPGGVVQKVSVCHLFFFVFV